MTENSELYISTFAPFFVAIYNGLGISKIFQMELLANFVYNLVTTFLVQ